MTSWGNAWLAGLAGLDDLAEALQACMAQGARCVHAPELDESRAQPLLLHLGDLRRAGVAWFRLALPAPGDVADLAGPQEARRAALGAGAAVIGGRSATRPAQGGVILVPPGSVAGECWRSWPADVTVWTLVNPGEAEHELLACLRAVADDLMRLDVARDANGAIAALATGAAPSAARVPPGLPDRSVELLDRCDRVSAILAAAGRDEGASVSRSEFQGRSTALARLATATRRARAQAWSAGALALGAAS